MGQTGGTINHESFIDVIKRSAAIDEMKAVTQNRFRLINLDTAQQLLALESDPFLHNAPRRVIIYEISVGEESIDPYPKQPRGVARFEVVIVTGLPMVDLSSGSVFIANSLPHEVPQIRTNRLELNVRSANGNEPLSLPTAARHRYTYATSRNYTLTHNSAALAIECPLGPEGWLSDPAQLATHIQEHGNSMMKRIGEDLPITNDIKQYLTEIETTIALTRVCTDALLITPELGYYVSAPTEEAIK